MSFWRSPFPFPAKNLTQTGLIRKWIKRFKEQQRDPFVNPNPSSYPGTGLLLGRCLAKIVPSPTCHQSVSDRTRASCRSFRTPAPPFTSKTHNKKDVSGDEEGTAWREAATFLQSRKQPAHQACLPHTTGQARNPSQLCLSHSQLGIIYYSNCSPLRLTSVFTIKKDDPTLGSWVYFPGDNSRCVVKIIAL